MGNDCLEKTRRWFRLRQTWILRKGAVNSQNSKKLKGDLATNVWKWSASYAGLSKGVFSSLCLRWSALDKKISATTSINISTTTYTLKTRSFSSENSSWSGDRLRSISSTTPDGKKNLHHATLLGPVYYYLVDTCLPKRKLTPLTNQLAGFFF